MGSARPESPSLATGDGEESPSPKIVRAPNGSAYLNLGCGSRYSEEWTNVDYSAASGSVIRHDLNEPLPFPDATFDVVYSSHVLEHFDPDKGSELVREMARVLAPGGTLRVVVPDLEDLARQYLGRLDEVLDGQKEGADVRYDWSVLELLDQMVRTRTGGRIGNALDSGRFDPEYIRVRNGDEYARYYTELPASSAVPEPDLEPEPPPMHQTPSVMVRAVDLAGKTWRRIKPAPPPEPSPPPALPSPEETGELHRWMYDRYSLVRLLEDVGLTDVGVRGYAESAIPDWDRYRLDSSDIWEAARKPDSLFVEGSRE